mgnify:CR=1 FL=1
MQAVVFETLHLHFSFCLPLQPLHSTVLRSKNKTTLLFGPRNRALSQEGWPGQSTRYVTVPDGPASKRATRNASRAFLFSMARRICFGMCLSSHVQCIPVESITSAPAPTLSSGMCSSISLSGNCPRFVENGPWQSEQRKSFMIPTATNRSSPFRPLHHSFSSREILVD